MAKTFTREEALSATTEYFNGDTFAADVFLKKYALRDSDDNFLEKTPRDTVSYTHLTLPTIYSV